MKLPVQEGRPPGTSLFDPEAAGQAVTGTVGTGPGALPNATIYRREAEYLVTQGNTIASYVSQATRGGIVDEFIRLGGRL
jgi:hypothetical protein